MHTYVNAPFINLLMLNAWTKFKINVWEDITKEINLSIMIFTGKYR